MDAVEHASALDQKVGRYFPGGSLGMFRPPLDPPPVVTHARGSRIFDARGREYIDFIMGSGPLILGHAHPTLISAVERQLTRGSTYYWLNEPIVELAEKIVQAAPCGGKVRFANSGTEATHHALRFARTFTGRERVLKFEGGYHGVHDYSLMSAGPKVAGGYPVAKPDSAGIPKGVAESVLVAPFNDGPAAVGLIEAHHQELAAVIVEPLQRALKPRGAFLAEVREATARFQIPLIFDEVVTGFRLAYGGAQEHYGVTADVAIYGKALTGGFSLAAICGRADILETSNPDRAGTGTHAYFSGTLNGNPLAAAAGLACLGELAKDGVLKNLHDRGERFMDEIREVGRSCGVPLQVAGDGPVLQPFFTERPVRDYPDTLTQDKALGLKVARQMWANGIMLVPNGKIYLSLAHSEEDLGRFLEALRQSLQEAKEIP